MHILPGTIKKGNHYSGAIFSECGKYRYVLWRRWDTLLPGTKKMAAFVGLNPSTADEVTNDNTVQICTNYAKAWGFAGVYMLNIFSFMATDPNDMKSQYEPIGKPINDNYLTLVCMSAGIVIVCWGTHGTYMNRANVVLNIMADLNIRLHCLKLTKHNHPHHPLYLKSKIKPILYNY